MRALEATGDRESARTATAQLARAWRRLHQAADPLEALSALRSLEGWVRQTEHALVDEARARGATWQAIADVYRISRQSAHERWARPKNAKAPHPTG